MDDVKFSHGIGITAGIGKKPVLGADISTTYRSEGDADVEGGVYLVVPLTESKSRSKNGVTTYGPADQAIRDGSAKVKAGQKGEFIGLNLNAGAALGLGINLNFKLGFNISVDND